MGDTFALVDEAGKFGRVDPEHDQTGDAIHFDRDEARGHEHLTVETDGDDFVLRFIASGRVACLMPDGRWETRADVRSYEKQQTTVQPDGRVLVYRVHDGVVVYGGELRKVA